jgi:hypothetical protein
LHQQRTDATHAFVRLLTRRTRFEVLADGELRRFIKLTVDVRRQLIV